MSDDIKTRDMSINSTTKVVKYSNTYSMFPFIWKVLPHQRSKFCVVIIADSNSVCGKNLYTYVKNAFCNNFQEKSGSIDNCITVLREDNKLVNDDYTNNIFIPRETAKQKRKERIQNARMKGKPFDEPFVEDANIDYELIEKYSRRVRGVVVDMSSGNKFKSWDDNGHGAPSIITSYPKREEYSNNNSWLYNSKIKKLLIPSMKMREVHDNYSYTIFLTDDENNIPTILWNNVSMCFIENKARALNVIHNVYKNQGNVSVNDDNILVIDSGIGIDIKWSIMNKNKYG